MQFYQKRCDGSRKVELYLDFPYINAGFGQLGMLELHLEDAYNIGFQHGLAAMDALHPNLSESNLKLISIFN